MPCSTTLHITLANHTPQPHHLITQTMVANTPTNAKAKEEAAVWMSALISNTISTHVAFIGTQTKDLIPH